MRLMRRRIMQAKACAHQRTKSCEATLCSVIEETKCIFRAVYCIKYSCDHCVTGDTYNNTRIYKKFNG